MRLLYKQAVPISQRPDRFLRMHLASLAAPAKDAVEAQMVDMQHGESVSQRKGEPGWLPR